MWGGKASKMATQAAPAKMTRQDPPRPATYHVTGGGGKMGLKDYSKLLISHNRHVALIYMDVQILLT